MNRGSRADRDIGRNVKLHNRIARKYDSIHGEIFNDVEQARLRSTLARALAAVTTRSTPVAALDFGCGSGNLTSHLLELGARVTAADVSAGCLDLVRSRYGAAALDTLLISGRDLESVDDAQFDVVATYSVLHHIPDYLSAVGEMARVCRVGGVVVIDHEATEESWAGDPLYRRFQREALRIDWHKYLKPSNYLHRLRRFFDPRHSNEGDIHVWPDDHIEWTRIKRLMARNGFEIVAEDDYLLNRKLYRTEVFARYAGRCTDTKSMIFRKREIQRD